MFYGFCSFTNQTWGKPASSFPADRHPPTPHPDPSPAPLTEMPFHRILSPLQGPEPEWELEAFPLSGLVLGAFLVTV